MPNCQWIKSPTLIAKANHIFLWIKGFMESWALNEKYLYLKTKGTKSILLLHARKKPAKGKTNAKSIKNTLNATNNAYEQHSIICSADGQTIAHTQQHTKDKSKAKQFSCTG